MNHNDPKAAFEAETDDHGEQQTRAISMLSGNGEPGFIDAEPADGGGRESRGLMSHTSVVIVIVAVVAAGSLYAMRLTQHADADTTKANGKLEANLENWIAKLSQPEKVDPADPMHPDNLSALFAGTEDVLRVLSLDSTEHQVPIAYVKKNPFTFSPVDDGGEVTAVLDPGASERARAMRRQQLQLTLSKYRIDSIMLGTRKVAMINGDMYQAGDHLGDFVIEEVQAMQVRLRNGQEKFVLSIDMSSDAAPKKKR